MSTKLLVQAFNKATGYKSSLYGVLSPVELFAEVAAKNFESGQTMDDWTFLLVNDNSDVLDNDYDWKSLNVSIRMGDLFEKFVNPKAGK